MAMESVEQLKAQVKQLTEELENEKKRIGSKGREKIAQMSSEVVDSNPYR